MDTRDQQLKILGNYLKSRRAKITPDRVGIPHDPSKRRTPGLRREEVAQLAGVSMTWYTWLEQGRDINVSKQVLDSIGRALQLSLDEHMHMLHLSGALIQASIPTDNISSISPALQKIIDDLTYPAMIVNNRTDVLAWNKAACNDYVDFSVLPEKERNIVWLWVVNKSFQSRIANWEVCAEYVVAVCRSFWDQYSGDQWISPFVENLKKVSPFFKEHWNRYNVRKKTKFIIQFINRDSNIQPFETTFFPRINDKDGIHLFICTPFID